MKVNQILNDPKKWLVRTGALLLLLGFVLPSLTVSCSALPGLTRSLSLADLAVNPQLNGTLLYLIPFAGLVILVLTVIPAIDPKQRLINFLVQIGTAALAALSIIFTFLPLATDASIAGISISPQFGAIILFVGYVLIGAGLVVQIPEYPWQEVQRWLVRPPLSQDYTLTAGPPSSYNMYGTAPPENYSFYDDPARGGAPAMSPLPLDTAGKQNYPIHSSSSTISARLRVISANVDRDYFTLDASIINIGRYMDNQVVLNHPTVSRHHACLRYARGAWFLQDQESSGGVWVNGRKASAARLKTGDRICLGEVELMFECIDGS